MEAEKQPKPVWLSNCEVECNIFPMDNTMTIKVYPAASVEGVLSEIQSLCGCMREINEAVQEGHLSGNCGKVSMIYLQGLSTAMLESVAKGVWQSEFDLPAELVRLRK